MKSNKGFTLIELLAVIVILAIVALVATPVILNIINSNTDKAKSASSRYVIKSIELAYTIKTSENSGSLPTAIQLKDQFNSIMDSGTSWASTTVGAAATIANEAITSGNVKCNVATEAISGSTDVNLTVTCPLYSDASGQSTVSTKALRVAAS